jgi:hypothetical protein
LPASAKTVWAIATLDRQALNSRRVDGVQPTSKKQAAKKTQIPCSTRSEILL